ncbi:haloacid dehalogenase superfamily, subfamily IA, variant 3 with third motif having DD or ED [Micromonospora phaseoli]|uniref:Haloacid dehalogenase superfamily, subfamily IA, variant 3 with third motif having DD or ED n=1 Tax=Micromonospora phaseoli TaxID=1144548 RepID=A0A1H7DMK3_9ACTN|nr:HAD-IA family hydrolase [Micromonospora phaseoli]PZV89435.1 HAD superfamily hydrolase (TIGR01509 family) [Micromonospora phaseoli]SEK02798.1 haloacid dehalogenase superfamily, subfamily IA, variant 3 with third motif having DD or ED [Micromonospora phaseoli]
MLPLPTGEFQAYLFDCDGTIVDSMPQHYTAWRETLDQWGCAFPEDLFYAWAGRPTADIVAALNEQHGLDMPLETVVARREARFQQLLPTATGIPGVLQHIDDAHGRIPFAVVSGSTREAVTASLDALGILDRFDVLVCAGDYARAKPDPEPFLRAAELLGVAPRSCLVFEDADLGMQAAAAAGMAAVRVPQPRQG